MVEPYIMYANWPEAILFFGLTIGSILMINDYRNEQKRDRYRK
jgi:hypothetical protein